ncbi:MAG: hypothetical protein ACI9PY_003758 [Ascidiaceihabitans sp.]|jgi:hypothetical protein
MNVKTLQYGYIGMGMGALGLGLAVVHFFAGPFSPQQNIDISLGEMAANMAKSATREFLNQPQPAPLPKIWDLDAILRAVAAVASALAIILAVVAFVLKENQRVVMAAAVLGSAALAFQFAIVLLFAIFFLFLIYIISNSLGFDFDFG